ncbi:PD-(D/E)XK nuclease family protein [Marinomonas rhizomae]|uniref:PDDEXK-like family protein n=1 Tax=Marinomonas rhizomae TaxID=491948 RepID=UPI0021021261|nr:PD-(D/E)XK nuclease family protein [Marinomonas rhizomae]UTW01214.1 PD-(D/E)XK nuclease family protein [Marinomonas rhizomae]
MSTLQQIQSFLDTLRQLPKPNTPEATIFSIGSRGYYENPTTDILAFFCNNNGEHGLGSLVLEALVDILPEKLQSISCSLSTPPEREVITSSNKRIDLIFESKDWVMIIENKIFHEQNNPFDDYQNHFTKNEEKRFKNKEAIFIVLSPSGATPTDFDKWIGISYPRLIDSIKHRLAEYFFKQPLNKWTVLLREFLLHLESIMSTSSYPEENIDYVIANLSRFREAQQLQDQSLKAFQEQLQIQLSTELGVIINVKADNWDGSPVMRFAYQSWISNSDIALSFGSSEDNENRYRISCYAGNIVNEEDRNHADSILNTNDCDIAPWNELKNTFRCYRTYLEDFDRKEILKNLVEKLKLMDSFEKR